jgi:hypothetical protein
MRKSSHFLRELWEYSRKTRISAWLWVAVLIFISATLAGYVVYVSSSISSQITTKPYVRPSFKKLPDGKKVYVPGPISMDKMKTRGCVADGLLSGYGEDTGSAVALINRSDCEYLHRSLESWANPPDFDLAQRIMEKINKPGIIYGMFIAEAIRKNAKFYYSDENRYFNFSKMCRGGSDNAWGEHTCKPNLENKEYQKYVNYITRLAMDMGIQSFLFGQINYQESGNGKGPAVPKVLAGMREYAKEKGIQIAIGAQTNSITDPAYLQLFDYIEGGVGINSQGDIENGPCLSRKSSCWALLWHPDFSSKANNVFLHLDWSGLIYDDMSVFARMDKNTREKTLRNLYRYFISRNMGFMMPYLATINKTNDGCYGSKKRFYSPDNKYSCRDEDAIKKIFNGS